MTAAPFSSASSTVSLVSCGTGTITSTSGTIGGATTSASLSNLQSCVTNSMQVGRTQEPEISLKLSKYFRSDLIAHVTNWSAEHIEKQVIPIPSAHVCGIVDNVYNYFLYIRHKNVPKINMYVEICNAQRYRRN